MGDLQNSVVVVVEGKGGIFAQDLGHIVGPLN